MGKIAALRTVREKVLELNNAMNELGRPILEDLSLLPRIHRIYQGLFSRRECPEKSSKVYHRQKFIFVALYLYSPKTLAGDRIRMGLRDKIAEVLGLSSGTPISESCSKIMFSYNNYRDFRRDVDIIYGDVVAELGDHMLLPG